MPRVRLLQSETRPAAQPPLCLVCGQSAACHVSKQFSWRPTWLNYSLWPLLLCFFPAAVVLLLIGFAKTRRATVETPLCGRHRNYWSMRGLWTYVPLIGLVAGVVAFVALFRLEKLDDDFFAWTLLGLIVAVVGWAIFAVIMSRSTIRAVEITDTDISLEPVAIEYADALRRERNIQKRNPALAWDDYDPYPRG